MGCCSGRSFPSVSPRVLNLVLASTLVSVIAFIKPIMAVTGDALTVAINPGQSVFGPRDPIEFSVVLTNQSDDPVMVNRRMELQRPELYLEIRDARGNLRRWMPPVPPPPLARDDFQVIASEDEIAVTVTDVSRYLSVSLAPGVYSVRARYRNSMRGDEFGLDAWTGEVVSEVSRFEVQS